MATSLRITEGAGDSAPGLAAFAAAAGDGRDHALAPLESAGRRVLAAEAPGSWLPGPYAGVLTLGELSLELVPRMGWDGLTGWVEAATGLSSEGLTADAPATTLAALVWARAVDGASRHGPPAFRRDVAHTGAGVRGRVDVRRTVRLRASGSTEVASVYRARDLDNPVTRVIVAADRVLSRRVSGTHWRTERVEQILPQLYAAVGRQAAVPGEGALHRMRYTPITRPFKWAAELSHRVVSQDGVLTTAPPGRPQGLLLDIEATATACLLAWARETRPDLRATVEDGAVVVREQRVVRARLAADLRAGERGIAVSISPPDGGPARRTVTEDAAPARDSVVGALAAL